MNKKFFLIILIVCFSLIIYACYQEGGDDDTELNITVYNGNLKIEDSIFDEELFQHVDLLIMEYDKNNQNLNFRIHDLGIDYKYISMLLYKGKAYVIMKKEVWSVAEISQYKDIKEGEYTHKEIKKLLEDMLNN